jgi:hypothetical protein
MKPLTNDQAMAELRKFAGIQFDPAMVDAFARTHWAAGVHDPGRASEPRPPVPLIAQAAGRMAQAVGARDDARASMTPGAGSRGRAGTNGGTGTTGDAGTSRLAVVPPAMSTSAGGTLASGPTAPGASATAPDPAS